jgi:mannose-6-phosphate isomerase-like protein (cupin superfamily)
MASESFGPLILVRSEDSDGRVGVIELVVPAGWIGPPLHHHAFDEAFYVLEGELTFRLGDDLVTRGPGSHAFAPSGSRHTLSNLADRPARYLIVCTPGGFERRFDPEPRKPYPRTTFVGPPIEP